VAGKAADALVGKFDDTSSGGKQRVILALHDVLACADRAATLANDNIARFHEFTGVFLNTKALTLGIAAVTS